MIYRLIQRIQQSGAQNNGCAILVVMEGRSMQSLDQFILDSETLWGFVILQIHSSECWYQRCNNSDRLIRIMTVDFNIERFDICEFLE